MSAVDLRPVVNGTARRVAIARSKDIISSVAAKHNLQAVDLLKPGRFPHIVSARVEAMSELRSAGFSYCQIGRLLNVDHGTHNSRGPRAPHCSLSRKDDQTVGDSTMKRRGNEVAVKELTIAFPAHVWAFIDEMARETYTTPAVIVRERMRELAEYEKAARAVA